MGVPPPRGPGLLLKVQTTILFEIQTGNIHIPQRGPPLSPGGGGGGTLGISGWGCAAGTLEPLTYTRASSTEFCYPILE